MILLNMYIFFHFWELLYYLETYYAFNNVSLQQIEDPNNSTNFPQSI